jgi:hypothetical protein
MSHRNRNARRQATVPTATGPRISRRAWIGIAASGAAVVLIGRRAWPHRVAPAGTPAVTVFRSPSCSCCGEWISQMQSAGFTIDERAVEDISLAKRSLKVPENLYACHTAQAGDFVFEGHVPPDLVERVLSERPAIRGLAVPGMPQSAPGMDIGHVPYDVISFDAGGRTAVYATRS